MDIDMRLCTRAAINKQSRLLFTAITFALLAGCGSGGLSGGSNSFTGYAQCANPGPGLAAVDLSGQCRATPQATMGALEAVNG